MGAIALLPIPLWTLPEKRDLLESYGAGVKPVGESPLSTERTEHRGPNVAISAQSMRVLQ